MLVFVAAFQAKKLARAEDGLKSLKSLTGLSPTQESDSQVQQSKALK